MKYFYEYCNALLGSIHFYRLRNYNLTNAQIKKYAIRENARIAATLEYLDVFDVEEQIHDLDSFEQCSCGRWYRRTTENHACYRCYIKRLEAAPLS